MNIYNEERTKILNEYELDFAKGFLADDFEVVHHDKVEGREGVGHYETVAVYRNGGKDVKWVWDIEPIEACEEYDETVPCKVYVLKNKSESYLNTNTKSAEEERPPVEEKEEPPVEEPSEEEKIRWQRDMECFPIINRGKLWYDKLTEEQLAELNVWYEAWLDAPQTLVIPTKPTWLD